MLWSIQAARSNPFVASHRPPSGASLTFRHRSHARLCSICLTLSTIRRRAGASRSVRRRLTKLRSA